MQKYQNFRIIGQVLFDANADIELELPLLAFGSRPPPHLPVPSLRRPDPATSTRQPLLILSPKDPAFIPKQRRPQRRRRRVAETDGPGVQGGGGAEGGGEGDGAQQGPRHLGVARAEAAEERGITGEHKRGRGSFGKMGRGGFHFLFVAKRDWACAL